MRRIALLLLLLAQPTPPPLRATWIGTHQARVEHAAGCLYRNGTLIRCYDHSGVAIIGGSQTDAAYRPSAGDVFRLQRPDGTVERAALRSVVYLPIIRQESKAP